MWGGLQPARDFSPALRGAREAVVGGSQRRFGAMPLAVTDAFLAFQLRHYVPQIARERIVYVVDGDLQPPGSPHYSIDRLLPRLYLSGLPLPVRQASEFYRATGTFLLAHSGAWGGAAMQRIHDHGCVPTPVGEWNGQVLFLVEHCN